METSSWQVRRILGCLTSIAFAIVAFLLLFASSGQFVRAEPVTETTQMAMVQTNVDTTAAITELHASSTEISPPSSQQQTPTLSEVVTPQAPEGADSQSTVATEQTDNQAPVAAKDVNKEILVEETKNGEETADPQTADPESQVTKAEQKQTSVKPESNQAVPVAQSTVQTQSAKKVQATLAAAKESTAEDVVVTNEQQLNDALTASPNDGTVQTIVLGGSFDTVKGIFIKQGQNITFINQGDAVKLNIGQNIQVEKGATVTFKGNQKDGITILPSDNYDVTQMPVVIEGTADLTNTTIQDFSLRLRNPAITSGTVMVNGGQLTMNDNAQVINNHIFAEERSSLNIAGGISVRNKGTLIMNDGSLVGGNSTEWWNENAAGGVGVHGGATFIMNGGTILHNAAPDGGGVIVGEVNEYKSDQNPVSTMVMNGGTIDSNISWRQAGGLFVNGNADVTINGGSIINNETGLIGAQPNPAGVGAGIVVHSGYRGQPDFNVDDINAWNLGKLTINDAIIDGNHASAAGGGIYVNSNNVTINKAQITNNVADIHGGGIYISIAEFTLHLGNSLITENEATDGVTSGVPGAPLLPGSGGGIWFCPTGSAMVYVTDGTAIFGNKALNHGDDILSEAKSADELTTLSNRMLGGGGAKWMHDRDGEQETTPVTVQNETGYIGLKNTATKAAEAVAAGMATVLIKGNKAPRGGGIGANGSVIFGSNVAGKAIKVNKEWDLGKTTTKPNKVTLNLVIDDATSPQNGEIVDTIELNADNNWTAQFADLPANVQYRVTEDKLEGFDSTNTELKDLGNGVFEVTFTNKAIEKPVNPDKPVVPDKPATPLDKPVTPPDTPVTPVTPVTPEQPVVPVQPNVVITPSEVVPVNEITEPGKLNQVVEGNDQADPKATRQIPEVTPQVTDQKVVTPVKLSETITPVTDQPASIQVEKQQAELPQTGDKQSITPIMLGFLLMLASLGGLVLSKKRHEFK